MVNRLQGGGGQMNVAQLQLQRQSLVTRRGQPNSATFTSAVATGKSPATAPASATATTASATPGILGDVDGDGVRSKQDAQALLNYLFAGGAQPIAMEQADVNADGQVNVADTVALLGMLDDPPVPEEPAVVPGDVDGDGVQTAQDAKALLSYLFRGGSAPGNMEGADANGDGQVNISDAIAIYNNVAQQNSGPVAAAGTAAGNNTQTLTSNLLRPNIATALRAYSLP